MAVTTNVPKSRGSLPGLNAVQTSETGPLHSLREIWRSSRDNVEFHSLERVTKSSGFFGEMRGVPVKHSNTLSVSAPNESDAYSWRKTWGVPE